MSSSSQLTPRSETISRRYLSIERDLFGPIQFGCSVALVALFACVYSLWYREVSFDTFARDKHLVDLCVRFGRSASLLDDSAVVSSRRL